MELAALDLLADLLQTCNDLARFLVADHADAGQAARVRDGAGDVLAPQRAVDLHAGVQHFHGRIQPRGQAAASTDAHRFLSSINGSSTPASRAASLARNLR